MIVIAVWTSRHKMILNPKRIKSRKQVNSLNAIFKGVLVAIILALLPAIQYTSAVATGNNPARITLKIDTSTHTIITNTEVSKPNIVVGESIVDRDARLAREKAEADALVLKLSREVVAREIRVYKSALPENSDLTAVYKSAAATYGIADWRYLKAIHYVETGCDISGNKRNPSGASGPMQFLPSTWRSWGVDGDGDGRADINNVVDAIYGAARYLAVSGGGSDIRTGLYSYNHSTSYVNKVTAVAMSIGQ